VAEVREADDRPPPDPHQVGQHPLGVAGRLQRLAQDDEVEDVRRIAAEVGVGVALDDGQAVADADVDAGLAEFDAAAVDPLLANQVRQQRAVARSRRRAPAPRSGSCRR
jgi:hypothetical protein